MRTVCWTTHRPNITKMLSVKTWSIGFCNWWKKFQTFNLNRSIFLDFDLVLYSAYTYMYISEIRFSTIIQWFLYFKSSQIDFLKRTKKFFFRKLGAHFIFQSNGNLTHMTLIMCGKWKKFLLDDFSIVFHNWSKPVFPLVILTN